MTAAHGVMTFTQGPFCPGQPGLRGKDAVAEILRQAPNVFCVVCRRRNGNVVLYEGLHQSGALKVDHYWLELEPSYMERARSGGRAHDRCEMSKLDNIAYGYESKTLRPGQKIQLRLQQLPNHPFIVTKRRHNGQERVDAYIRVKNRLLKVKWVWIEDDGNLWPRVSYVDLHCEDARQGGTVVERITPS